MKYIIGYDITEPKRLGKIYKKIIKFATPIQYSLFLYEGTEKELTNAMQSILNLLDKKTDDLRIYPIFSSVKQWGLGKTILPEGLLFSPLLTIQNNRDI